jgi:hypothetical protein
MYEALTMPAAVPALGHGVRTDYRTHPKDLLAQKVSLFVPLVAEAMYGPRTSESILMDLGIALAIAMLLVWAIGTVAFEAPGWLHILLTAGVFLLIHRIVVRGTPDPKIRDAERR